MKTHTWKDVSCTLRQILGFEPSSIKLVVVAVFPLHFLPFCSEYFEGFRKIQSFGSIPAIEGVPPAVVLSIHKLFISIFIGEFPKRTNLR